WKLPHYKEIRGVGERCATALAGNERGAERFEAKHPAVGSEPIEGRDRAAALECPADGLKHSGHAQRPSFDPIIQCVKRRIPDSGSELGRAARERDALRQPSKSGWILVFDGQAHQRWIEQASRRKLLLQRFEKLQGATAQRQSNRLAIRAQRAQ